MQPITAHQIEMSGMATPAHVLSSCQETPCSVSRVRAAPPVMARGQRKLTAACSTTGARATLMCLR